MTKPILIYCFDAYCGWCYGFGKVINQINEKFIEQLDIEIINGGMVLPKKPTPISVTANYILQAMPIVEQTCGVVFGEDYKWHLNNPNLSDWFPNSEIPAIASCIFKELYPNNQLNWAKDIQYALFFEGRDLTDDEAYTHLLIKYNIDKTDFYIKLKDDIYKQKAYNEFEICKQLNITGYPTLLLQMNNNKIYTICNGYTTEMLISERIEAILKSETL